MDELRRRTRDAHERVEALPLLAAALAPGFSLSDYGRLLLSLRGFYQTMEAGLFDGLPESLACGVAHRRKTALLDRDIEALSAHCRATPAFSTGAASWSAARKMGGLYVLEGATLGGQLIRRQLLRQFGPEIETALAFYSCYGARVGAEWTAFRALLSHRYDGRPAEIEEVVDGALAVFGALQNWLTPLECEAE